MNSFFEKIFLAIQKRITQEVPGNIMDRPRLRTISLRRIQAYDFPHDAY
ncbi:hypothetical protein [Flavobacterium covae]